MTDEEREAAAQDGCTATRRPPPARRQAHGHAEGRKIPFAEPGSKTRPLLISLGQGRRRQVERHRQPRRRAGPAGPLGRRRRRRHLRLLDPAHARRRPRAGRDRRDDACRPRAWGVRCISIGYFVPEGQAVIWRGPMLHKALEQFLTDVFWDEPDFLLDRHAARHRRHRPQPQPVPAAGRGLRRHHAAAGGPEGRPRCRRRWPRRSTCRSRASSRTCRWFTGDDGKRYEIFGAGGGQELADELGVPAARSSCRWCPALREGGDDGHADHRRRSRQRGRPGVPRDGRADRRRAASRRRSSAQPSRSADRQSPHVRSADLLLRGLKPAASSCPHRKRRSTIRFDGGVGNSPRTYHAGRSRFR